MDPAVAMRSASWGFQAECCEGSQVGVRELMGNRSRLQEVEVLLERSAEAGTDQRRRSVIAVDVIEGIELVEGQPPLKLWLGEIVDLPQGLAEREA
ncbi:hypothetical protein ACSYS3_001730 [Stenotrophomonas maltophilia]